MERPNCKLCGNKHYSSEPHIWDDDPTDVVGVEGGKATSTVRGKTGKRKVAPKDAVAVRPVVDRSTAPAPAEKKPFDRLEYQREYMRKRRKKLKEETK